MTALYYQLRERCAPGVWYAVGDYIVDLAEALQELQRMQGDGLDVALVERSSSGAIRVVPGSSGRRAPRRDQAHMAALARQRKELRRKKIMPDVEY